MTTYTTEDFEKAQFAKHPHGATATRDNYRNLWVLSNGCPPMTNMEMAVGGWVPVRENAPLSLDTLAGAWEAAEADRLIARIRADAWDQCAALWDRYCIGVREYNEGQASFPTAPTNPYREDKP